MTILSASCLAAPNIDPFRLPTLAQANRFEPTWVKALTVHEAGSTYARCIVKEIYMGLTADDIA
jgi:hypothetical protein